MKRTPRQKLIDKLDDLVRDRLKEEYPEICVTCGRRIGWFHPINNNHGLQVGHYISRDIKQLRWHPKNVHPQCAGCNWEHNSNPIPYTKFMLETYGQEILDELENERLKAKSEVKPLPESKLQEIYDTQNSKTNP
jgi:hypothetical protein